MGKVKKLLLNFLNTVEETLNEKVKSLSAKQELELAPKEPVFMSHDECLFFNRKSNEENINILKTLDYKTYLLLSILPSIKIDDRDPQTALDIFVSEQLLMENWLEHMANLNKIKIFQTLIKTPKVLSSKSSSTKKSIKCLRDLPLQKQTLN